MKKKSICSHFVIWLSGDLKRENQLDGKLSVRVEWCVKLQEQSLKKLKRPQRPEKVPKKRLNGIMKTTQLDYERYS